MSILRASASFVLLGTLLFAAPAVAEETLQVNMSNYEFAPNTLQLRANNSYRLRLTNTARGSHDFDAPQLFAASSIAPADQSKVADGAIEVEGGQTVEVNFTPTRAGTYKFHCSHFLHSAFGMTGEVVVH